ncbi:hypothetical protein D0B54_00360 [Solimonas sp. K1W22B-7]|uniref:hypothetical protein n=1 Tax=Solimonas sp. K1W22B-7 TaxID=2303331 RepID=UPI000E33432F|nr:hypothetical protein [Solimonas sp. K1W22B-7]AXQ27234.1 hypothetical protein D0B54_00360 [Solimonas sp. K1W22B-7]
MPQLRAALLLLTALLAGCQATPLRPPPPAPGAAPDWVQIGAHSYEQEAPGLGASRKYQGPAGTIDVYRYDLRRAWQDGLGDPAFNPHFQSTIEEVKYMAAQGRYSGLQIGPVRDVVVAGLPFRTVSYHFRVYGREMSSQTYLTATGSRLLKYRMSFFDPPAVDAAEMARRFIETDLSRPPAEGDEPLAPPGSSL